jgi:hypothetical protein
MILLVYQSSHRHLHRCVATSELTGCWDDWFICLTLVHGPSFRSLSTLPASKTISFVRNWYFQTYNNSYLNEFSTKTTQSFSSLSRNIYQRKKDKQRQENSTKTITILIIIPSNRFDTSFGSVRTQKPSHLLSSALHKYATYISENCIEWGFYWYSICLYWIELSLKSRVPTKPFPPWWNRSDDPKFAKWYIRPSVMPQLFSA